MLKLHDFCNRAVYRPFLANERDEQRCQLCDPIGRPATLPSWEQSFISGADHHQLAGDGVHCSDRLNGGRFRGHEPLIRV